MTRRLSLWFIALALVAAQTLGLVHRLVHVPVASPGASSVQDSAAPGDERSWSQELFAGHEGDPGCRLFDQLNASGVLTDLPCIPVPLAAPLHLLSWSHGEAVVRWATLFDARGPPALR